MSASATVHVTSAGSTVFADLGLDPEDVVYHLARAEQLLAEHEASGPIHLRPEEVPTHLPAPGW